MYSSVHGAAGTAIMATAYKLTGDTNLALMTGAPLAFLSHIPMDRLGEAGYSNIWKGEWKQTALWEGVPFVLFCLIFAQSPHWLMFAIGMIAASGMDLIDKGWRLITGNRDVEVHSVTPWVHFTLKQTKLLAVASVPIVWLLVEWV